MAKKPSHENLDRIEQSQQGLRDSIEETKRLAAEAESLVHRRRDPPDDPGSAAGS